MGIMEADIDSEVDAKTIAAEGALDPDSHRRYVPSGRGYDPSGYPGARVDDLDLVVLENVGNLVCPAEFDTGSVKNAMILSVPEGDDKPLKYPLMFSVCDAVVINKCDTLCVFDDFSKGGCGGADP